MTDEPRREADSDDSQPITSAQALAVLEHGALEEEVGLMRWSSNYTFLVSLCLDEIEISAVYKPRRGERPLWDFPDGTLCQRELAAYLTSEALGWELVPPTVLRNGSRGAGSFQFFIDHDPEQHYFTLDETYAPQLMRLSLFDVLINNADRKGGHCLLDSTGHLWAIDHGITFNAQHKLRTVIWDFAGQPVPAPLLRDVERLAALLDDADSAYRRQLDALLSDDESAAFRARIGRMLKTRRYPEPGPGPSYPWPPV